MLTQKLTQRIDIEATAPVVVDPVGGSQVNTWALFASDVPAEVVPLSGREFIAAGAEQAGVVARVTIRRLEGVLPSMRIRHLGLVYNILQVLPDPTFRRHLTLMVESGVPAPAIEYEPESA